MRLATLCTNRKSCCLPLHMAVRLTPAVDSVQVWNCYSCYAIVESVWSEVVFVRCVTKMDRQKFEQSCAIKFCVKLGKSSTMTYERLQRPYGEHSLSRAHVFRWHNSFLEGQEQVEDELRAGRLWTSKTDDNVGRVRSLVRSDRRLTLRMISSELYLNRFTVHQILTQDLDMGNVCAKMHKANRRDMFIDLLDHLEREPEFFSRVITGDESCILDCGSETKRQIQEWQTVNSPRPKKARMSKSKIISILFFWLSGDHPQGICATRTNCHSNFLSGIPWKTQEKGDTCRTKHCTHLDAAPRQGPMPHVSLRQWIFGRRKHCCGSSVSLFAGSQSLWLFIPPAQKQFQVAPFWYLG